MAVLRPGGGGLMWRTAKADVAAELGLPPQHARLARLALSAIERHFYNRQHQVSSIVKYGDWDLQFVWRPWHPERHLMPKAPCAPT